MIIKLTEDYRINTSDSTCPIVIEKRKVSSEKAKTPGMETWVPFKYPGTYQHLEHSLINLGVTESEGLNELRAIMGEFIEAVRIVKETTRIGG